jgi:hypothetical protein
MRLQHPYAVQRFEDRWQVIFTRPPEPFIESEFELEAGAWLHALELNRRWWQERDALDLACLAIQKAETTTPFFVAACTWLTRRLKAVLLSLWPK